MLKSDTVPAVFCFSNPAKHRKLREARETRTLHCSVIEDLLKEPTMEPHSSKEPEPATKDIGIQCIIIYKIYIVSLFDKICHHI